MVITRDIGSEAGIDPESGEFRLGRRRSATPNAPGVLPSSPDHRGEIPGQFAEPRPLRRLLSITRSRWPRSWCLGRDHHRSTSIPSSPRTSWWSHTIKLAQMRAFDTSGWARDHSSRAAPPPPRPDEERPICTCRTGLQRRPRGARRERGGQDGADEPGTNGDGSTRAAPHLPHRRPPPQHADEHRRDDHERRLKSRPHRDAQAIPSATAEPRHDRTAPPSGAPEAARIVATTSDPNGHHTRRNPSRPLPSS